MQRPLIYYGDPLLRKRSLPIETINDEIKELAKDLCDTLAYYNGSGLAAIQIGVPLRMFIISLYQNEDNDEGYYADPTIFINPKLSSPSEELLLLSEGCLSIPRLYCDVMRPASIQVEALDIDGNPFSVFAKGWHAKAIMHENDHLNGVLLVDRLDPKERRRIEPFLKTCTKK